MIGQGHQTLIRDSIQSSAAGLSRDIRLKIINGRYIWISDLHLQMQSIHQIEQPFTLRLDHEATMPRRMSGQRHHGHAFGNRLTIINIPDAISIGLKKVFEDLYALGRNITAL